MKVGDKRVTGVFIEVKLKEVQGYFHVEVLTGDNSDFQPLTDNKGKRIMVRNRIDLLNKMYSYGYDMWDFSSKLKGNAVIYLLRKR